jgi:hypothetical protein
LIFRFERYLDLIRRFSLALTLILWLVAVVSRLLFNGPILGFDYAIYQPDGANYTFRTLSFLYENPLGAANKVSEWYALNGFNHNIIAPLTLLPENSPVWHLSAPRILYPLLSLPFVAALGISGMLVIPSLALLGIFLIVHQIAKTLMRPELGLLFSIGIASSSTISRWFVANLTDSLLAFLVGLIIVIEVKSKRLWLWILLVTIIVLLASATRFSVPIFLSLGLGYLLIKEVPKAITLVCSGFIGGLPLLFFNSSSAVLPGSHSDSLLEKLIDLPLHSIKVLVVETGQLVVLDRIFFFLVLFSLFCAFQLRNKVGILTISVFLGVLAVGFINGTLGVNFRYQLPLVPFMAWSFIHYLKLISTPTIR